MISNDSLFQFILTVTYRGKCISLGTSALPPLLHTGEKEVYCGSLHYTADAPCCSHSSLLYSALLYSVLLFSILFYSISFYCILLFHSILVKTMLVITY